MMKRRVFIAGLGSAAAWPMVARAQQGDRVRRIGVLLGGENDPVGKTIVSTFAQALAGLGWTDGRNVRMDHRWGGGDINRIQALAQELVGSQPVGVIQAAPPEVHPQVAANGPTQIRKRLRERGEERLVDGIVFVARCEHADAPYALALLRPRNRRPRRRAPEPRDELPPFDH